MISVIIGENPERAATAQKIIDSEIKKGKQAISFSDASWQKESVLSYTGGSDMFGNNYVIHLSRISDATDGLEFFLNNAPVLVESETMFVIEENEISKDLKKVFEDVNAKITEIKKAKPNFFDSKVLTPFQLVDAYNMRDKKTSWMLFNKLVEVGTGAEEIAGAMIWNFKNLALYFSAADSKTKPSAEALGMKPFVYSKVASASKNFSAQEVGTKAFQLSSALHKSHRGQGDGTTLLELFILKSL